MITAGAGYIDIVKLLLEGASPILPQLQKLRRIESKSYLGLLPKELLTPIAQYIKPPNKADPNMKDIDGKTALNYAIKGLEEVLKNP